MKLLNYRRKGRRHGGNQRLASNFGTRLQDRLLRRRRLQPVDENDFDAALPQNSLRKSRQRFRHFWQNSIAGLNDHAAMRLVAQVKEVPLDRPYKIVQLGH